MGEAGGRLPGCLPAKILHGCAGETSPPAFAAPYLRSTSRSLFVFYFERDPHGLSQKHAISKKLTCYEETKTMAARTQALFDREIIGRAVVDAFKKLHPLSLLKNPVIFVTEVGACFTTVGLFFRSEHEPF